MTKVKTTRHVWPEPVKSLLFTIIFVLVSTALRFALDPLLGNTVQYVTYFAAIITSAILFGFWPAVFATVLSCVVGAFFFIRPPISTHSMVVLIVFFCTGIFTSALTGFLQVSFKKVQARAQELAQYAALL